MQWIAIITFIYALSITCLWASDIQVIDGDTLKINTLTYRLYGIDAPEAGQKCNKATGGQWPCGQKAIEFIEKRATSNDVKCDHRGKDNYGRILSVCKINGHDLNQDIVLAGYAWAFRKYSTRYNDAEDQARQMNKGIWQAKTQTAWDYRAKKWDIGIQSASDGCPIKGNISKRGKIYHAPWSPWYKRTKISVSKGERWFCSEIEAKKAGWRAPQWGK